MNKTDFYNKLIHGDSLEELKKLPDGSVDLVCADLPFAMTDNKWDSLIPIDALWQEYLRVCKNNAAIVLNCMQPFTSMLITSQPKLFKYCYVWDKTQITGFLNAKKQPLRKHEDIAVFYKTQPTYNPQFTFGKPYKIHRTHATENYSKQMDNITESDGRRYPTSIINIPQKRIKGGHPTQKPVELLEFLIKTYSNAGDFVLDNTCGSGTTLVAAKNLGRYYCGIEKDDKYYNMALERLKP